MWRRKMEELKEEIKQIEDLWKKVYDVCVATPSLYTPHLPNLSENKVLHIAECFNSFLENNDSLIKNNFYSDDKELLQVCAKSVENILNKSKSKISRIDKLTQNIIPFMSYVNGTLLEVFKDIQIISDYFRLVSWNYTLCAEEVIVTTKYSDTPFSILYCLPFLEIKKYEVNINNLPTYVQRNKVFLKNDNYPIAVYSKK